MESENIIDNSENTIDTNNHIIEHIVLSGGGVYGFSEYGVLEHLHNIGYWNINNIKSIYGTSIGGIIGAIISLKYDFSVIRDYIIKRPWQHVFNFDMYSIINSIQKQGIFDIKIVKEIFKPLFGGLDIPINVTMEELYKFTDIDLHLIVTGLNDFESVDISHSTHPEWQVVDAVYASAALPVLFSPLLKDSKYYIDGGILCNYPLNNCINIGGNCHDSTLGIYTTNINIEMSLTDESSVFDYLFLIIYKMLHKFLPKMVLDVTHKHNIQIKTNSASLYDIYMCANFSDERLRLIDVGIQLAKEFLAVN